MSAPAVSVVIPAYNQAALLPRTLDALGRQTLSADLCEVIVVDDGSSDDTAAIVRGRAAADARLRLLQHPANRGRSAARNSGVRAARGEIVVFIDGDILVESGFLTHHLDAHRRAGRPVVCRGPVVDIAESDLPARPVVLVPSPAYLTTANASVPRGELLAAGLFDEKFPGYGWEDFDLGFRLRQRGLPRIYRRDAVAYHVTLGRRTLAEALRKEEDRARGAVYLYRKHPGWRTRMLIQLTLMHRALYFLLAGGGLLNQRTAAALAGRLRRTRHEMLADQIERMVLNRHYLTALRREWSASARPA
jgi:glycosyltransferase involved in cell wall biosynthesis